MHFVGGNIKCGDVDFPALGVVNKLECEKEQYLAIYFRDSIYLERAVAN